MKRFVYALLAAFALFVIVSPLYAFTQVGGDSINIATEIADDVYAFGNSINLLADLPEDFVAAGSNIRVSGNVGKDLIIAGGTLDVSGDVGDDARMAGGIVTVNSRIADDLILAGGRVTIGKDAAVGGDLVVNGGTVRIDGDVDSRILANGGTIDINGRVKGDVAIGNVGRLNIGPTAVLEGNLTYSSTQQASISEQAQIAGDIEFTVIEEPITKTRITPAAPLALFAATFLGGKVISFLSLFVLGILLMLFIPKIFERFNNRMSSTLGNCAGAGAVTFFGTPLALLVIFIISIFLFITVIGSGTGLMLLASIFVLSVLYSVLIYVSTVFLSYLLGKKILSRSSLDFNRYGWKVLAYLIGLVIISIAFAIPFVGWLARIAAILFGLGGLSLLIKDRVASASKS
ncbi:MAG: hypothetical protein ACQEP5_03745 [Actinomycetota bacterium]